MPLKIVTSWIFAGLMDPDYCKEGKEGPCTQSRGASRALILSGRDE